jgi:Rod binding domain-containing protein
MVTDALSNAQPAFHPPGTPDRAREVAREFESLFASMMMRSMRKTVGENELMPTSTGERIYTEMLDDEYARQLAKSGSLGLAELILKQIDPSQATGLDALKGLRGNSWDLDPNFMPRIQSRAADPAALLANVSKWDDITADAAKEHGVDANLIRSVIAQESAGNPYAVSRAGAKGLMQLIDSTAQDMGVSRVFDPRANIMGGAKYLASLLQKYNGNRELALAAYNAGPSAVDKYNGIPPYPETQDYVARVKALSQKFSDTAVAASQEAP